MNKIMRNLVNQVVSIEISGKQNINGRIIDLGSDTIVLYNGTDFYYIPFFHVQNFKVDHDNQYDIQNPTESSSILSEEKKDDLSLRKILTQAKGIFVEINVTGSQSLHGYITSIMNNYFVFHSPVYKTMFITMKHLKWLIPYPQNQRPYGLASHNFPIQTSNTQLARTFEVQIEKLKDQIVVFNMGESNNHIGKINNIEDQIIEIQTGRTQPFFINLQHVKTLHQV